MANYIDIRFLESTSNLRALVTRNSGRELSLEHANQICVCLEQGRLLFEAAQTVAWQIKPLLVFYGMVGFAKAIFLSRSQRKLETLPPRHGIKDVSRGSIEEMRVQIESDGTFQSLNDSISVLEGLIFHDAKGGKRRIKKPTANSSVLEGSEIGLKDILARIPDLGSLYKKTFDEPPKFARCSHFSEEEDDEEIIQFGLGDYRPFHDLSSLEVTVKELRNRFPFLNNWRVKYASPGMYIKFANLAGKPDSEFSPETLEERSNAFYLGLSYQSTQGSVLTRSPSVRFSVEDIANHCQPVTGSLTRGIESCYLAEPLNNHFLSEVSLYYLGMFLLSSLVRYRPNLWANVIAGRSFPEKPVNDRTLALIEEFINLSFTVFSQATVVVIDQPYSRS